MYQLVSVINQYWPLPDIKTSAYILSDVCSYKTYCFEIMPREMLLVIYNYFHIEVLVLWSPF